MTVATENVVTWPTDGLALDAMNLAKAAEEQSVRLQERDAAERLARHRREFVQNVATLSLADRRVQADYQQALTDVEQLLTTYTLREHTLTELDRAVAFVVTYRGLRFVGIPPHRYHGESSVQLVNECPRCHAPCGGTSIDNPHIGLGRLADAIKSWRPVTDVATGEMHECPDLREAREAEEEQETAELAAAQHTPRRQGEPPLIEALREFIEEVAGGRE